MLLNPDVLDLIHSFIPNQYIPKFLLNYINAGANWTVTTIWIIAALLISTCAVHRHNQKRLSATLSGLQNRLSAYEDHEPKYDIAVSKVEVVARTCSCHTQIIGLINIAPQNAWEGELSNKPFIRCDDNAVTKAFFSENIELSIEKSTGGRRFKVDFPYPIPTNGTTIFLFGLKFPLGDEDINSSILSKTVPFRIEFGELVKWCRPFRGGNFRPRPGVARIV